MWDAETNDEAIRRAALAEGEAKNRAETVRRMLDMNFTSEQIFQVTGLSLDEIEALRNGQS